MKIRQRIGALGTAAVLMLGLLPGCSRTPAAEEHRKASFLSPQTTENDLSSTEFRTMAETAQLRLELNADTGVIHVVSKETGRVWSSESSQGQAQLTLSYSNEAGTVGYMNSYDDAVKRGQYRVEAVDGGFRMQYSLGRIENNLLGPVLMSVEHFEAVREASSARNRQVLGTVYYLADVQTMEKEKREKLLADYPILADQPLYVLYNTSMTGSVKSQLDKVLREGGYTEEDQAEDEALYENLEEKAEPRFNVTVYYTLDGDALRVRIPMEELFCYDTVPMETLSVLPYFGQPSQEESGYWLLPDGSGSVMNWYNGKGDLQDYVLPIYGQNYDLLLDERVSENATAVLPLFGCHTGEDGFLSVIDGGAAMATLVAAPGNDRKLPQAYLRFRVTEKAQMDAIVVNSSTLNNNYYTLHETERYTGDLQLSYYFLSGESSDYSGMAQRYRALLPERTTAQTVPLVAETVGVVDVTGNILGISVRQQRLLTSYEEAARMARELKEAGADGLTLRLSGYLNGGYRQAILKKPAANSKAGSSREFGEWIAALEAEGIPAYLDADLQTAYKDGWFDGFSRSSDVIRFLSKEVGVQYPFNPASFQPLTSERARYILRPAAVRACAEAFGGFADTYGIGRLSLREIGQSLHADYTQEASTCREEALRQLTETVQRLGESHSLMLSGGQTAFAGMADLIVDLPLTDSGADITDYSVPFAAMVYSGRTAYTGGCSNLEYGSENEYLQLIENGAGLYVRLCAGDGMALQNTDFAAWFSCGYEVQKPKVLARYRTLCEALEGCAGLQLTEHRRISDQVACSTFASGIRLYVNYGDTPYTLENGAVVEAHGYYREKEAAA